MDVTCMFHAFSSLCRCVQNEAKCIMQIYNRSKTYLSCVIIRVNSTQAMRNDVFAIHRIHLTYQVIKKRVNASPGVVHAANISHISPLLVNNLHIIVFAVSSTPQLQLII